MQLKIIFLFTSLVWNQIAFSKDLRKPLPGNEAIYEAIKRYLIEVPTDAIIVYNSERTERAITIPPLGDNGGVFVILGPGAFTSWALLGSTLGHELEVHARQNISYAQDRTERDLPGGLFLIEVEAYLYEIKNKERFGTTEDELNRYVRRWLKEFVQAEHDVWKRVPSKQFYSLAGNNDYSAILEK